MDSDDIPPDKSGGQKMKKLSIKKNIATLSLLSVLSIVTFTAIPATAESEASVTAESESAGPLGVGQSEATTWSSSEATFIPLNSGSESSGCTSSSESGFTDHILIDGYYALNSNDQNQPERTTVQSVAQTKPKGAPEIVVTNYKWPTTAPNQVEFHTHNHV